MVASSFACSCSALSKLVIRECFLFLQVLVGKCHDFSINMILLPDLALLVSLFVADYRSSTGSGTVILDDCNFHESVRLDSFDVDRTLSLVSEILSIYPSTLLS